MKKVFIQINPEDHNSVIGKFNVKQPSLPNVYMVDSGKLEGLTMPCYDPVTDAVSEHPSARAVLEREYLEKIKAEADRKAAQLIQEYPEVEAKTWMQQREEAYAYKNDPSADTPLIDTLAATRGLDKDELVERIIQKAKAWSIAAGQIVGERQAKEDALETMSDLELKNYLRSV